MSEEIDYSKTAWGDESVRMHTDPPMYLLGACVFKANPRGLLSAIANLKPKGAKKLHWRELGNRAQQQSLEAIAKTPPVTHIVVASPLIHNKQERARRKCLQELCVRLEEQQIEQLILESRNIHQNKKDDDFLLYLRRCGAISRITLHHIEGGNEPLLDIPDQILGAYGNLRAPDMQTNWMDEWGKIEGVLNVFEVRP